MLRNFNNKFNSINLYIYKIRNIKVYNIKKKKRNPVKFLLASTKTSKLKFKGD